MEDRDFVFLAWNALHVAEYTKPLMCKTYRYEDDFIRLETNVPGHAIEIIRKSVIDDDRPHLSTERAVSIVTSLTADADPEIILHHEEHIYVAPHMMYLIELSPTFREFFNEMQTKYPDLVVKTGI